MILQPLPDEDGDFCVVSGAVSSPGVSMFAVSGSVPGVSLPRLPASCDGSGCPASASDSPVSTSVLGIGPTGLSMSNTYPSPLLRVIRGVFSPFGPTR